MDKKMMICQHSKECDHILKFSSGSSICGHWDKHKCKHLDSYCEREDGSWKCVPYVEPSPAKEALADALMSVVKKAGKQAKALHTAPQPEPSMPLICADCGVEDAGICEGHECAGRQRDADMKVLEAKVQQVRKDFAEECQQFYQAKSNRWQGFAAKTNMLMTYLNLNNGDRIYTEIYSAYKLGIADALAHLRAMAGER